MSERILKQATISFLVLYSMNVFSLVDYSDNESSSKMNTSTAKVSPRETSSNLIWKSDFSLETNYELIKINQDKVGLLNVGTH